MTTQTEALKMALEALEDRASLMKWQIARDAVKEALAQPEQEPVAWMYDQAKYRENDLRGRQWAFNCFSQNKPWVDDMVRNLTPLFTTPPQRKPLTDEEIKELYGDDDNFRMTKKYVIAFARAIEAKLKEKNT